MGGGRLTLRLMLHSFDVSTSITTTTFTRTFPTQTEVAVARQTCPATRDGKQPYQHGTDASNNSQCGVQNPGGANRMTCVYSKSPAIRGGLVYDSACGQCQPQMIGASPYSGYNDGVAKQARSGALGLFFVCPATDARSGSSLNMQYVDPQVGPNGGINVSGGRLISMEAGKADVDGGVATVQLPDARGLRRDVCL